MNCKEINQINTEELLRYFHIEPVRRTGMELLYRAPYRKDNSPSMSVNIGEKMVWFDHTTGQGGSNVDLLLLIYNVQSVGEVLKRFNNEFSKAHPTVIAIEKKSESTNQLELVKELENKSLIRYAQSRGIGHELAKSYLKEVHYSNRHGRFFSIGFMNDCGGYELRNGVMKNPICLGKKSITTINKESNNLLIFEGFFDFLSHLQLHKSTLSESVIVLNSVSQLSKTISYLTENDELQINLYLDNDSAGKKAANRLLNLFKDRVKDRSKIYDQSKDLNEHLQRHINLKQNNERRMCL